jgi:tetratricopeptide (TPR) repeat protein
MEALGLRRALVAGLLLGGGAAPARALPRRYMDDASPLRERGADVRTALLMDFYKELPQARDGEDAADRAARLQAALDAFKKKVAERYSEGTLQRLLDSPDAVARRAAVLALGLTGTMKSNKALAGRLHDDDGEVRRLAADGLWSLWYRGSTSANNRELQRLMRVRDPEEAITGLNTLIRKAPKFAEAYNQRAIRYFRLEKFHESITDCEIVIKLNPCHFGAQSGMAQCYMMLKKPRSALKAFRKALQINPDMEGVEETIRALEDVLGEEGRKDDKK